MENCCINPEWKVKNAICTKEYNPVIGCDGLEYNNPCIAKSNEVSKYIIKNTGEIIDLYWNCK